MRRIAIVAALSLALFGCGGSGSGDAKASSPGASSAASVTRTTLAGFGETKVSVQTPSSLLEWCLLLASTPQQQNKGLMNVVDPALGGYDGMLFRFDKDVTEGFWMKNTKLPLSIAFVSSDGHVVSQTDMDPCPDSGPCPNHYASGSYRLAIEVPRGKFTDLGLTADSVVTDEQRPC